VSVSVYSVCVFNMHISVVFALKLGLVTFCSGLTRDVKVFMRKKIN